MMKSGKLTRWRMVIDFPTGPKGSEIVAMGIWVKFFVYGMLNPDHLPIIQLPGPEIIIR
jgi:hypothetical protein